MSQVRLCPKRVSPKRQATALRTTRQAYPAHFSDQGAAWNFLFQIILPPSRKWGFISVGKNASSTTLDLLFRAEFGHALSARVTPPHDINSAASMHMLMEHSVFARALWQGLSVPDLFDPKKGPKERICVTRHPFQRAQSGFQYICKSHEARTQWFARDRFRMNAVVGFDWDRHSNTVDGFRRFLDYITWQIETEGPDAVDAHWRPQTSFIKPDVFQPTITGRVEDMPAYVKLLSERLDFALPKEIPALNKQEPRSSGYGKVKDLIASCETIYAADYELFEY